MHALADLPIAIIGAGRLAWSLGPALGAAGAAVTVVCSRSEPSAAALASTIGADVRTTVEPVEALVRAELILLTLPDGEIARSAAQLAWQARHRAVHFSGALGLDVLDPVRAAGGLRGCLHVLQTFPGREPHPERLRGVACGVEADAPLDTLLEGLAERLGASPFSLAGVDRAAYHAAAVFASNDVIALMSLAARTWALAGLPAETARAALAPLLLTTAQNAATRELPEALSGPVARGDAGTVRAHLAALAADRTLLDPYRLLARELLRVAQLDPSARGGLSDLLGD